MDRKNLSNLLLLSTPLLEKPKLSFFSSQVMVIILLITVISSTHLPNKDLLFTPLTEEVLGKVKAPEEKSTQSCLTITGVLSTWWWALKNTLKIFLNSLWVTPSEVSSQQDLLSKDLTFSKVLLYQFPFTITHTPSLKSFLPKLLNKQKPCLTHLHS